MGNSKSLSAGILDQQEEQEEENSTFTCEICIEPVLASKKFKNITKNCSHPFCVDCISKYIEVKVGDGDSEIKCPEPHCHEFLDTISCRPYLPSSIFEKWCDVLCKSAVLQWERAYCPYQECSALVLNECEAEILKSKCPNCNKFFCMKCKVPWHFGFQCNETGEMRDTNDILFGTLAETKKWMRCPRCKHFVELISGCNSVKCRCGTNFCHACGESTTEGCRCTRSTWRQECCRFVLLLLLISFTLGILVLFTIYSSSRRPQMTK